jgi:hypothetical protein
MLYKLTLGVVHCIFWGLLGAGIIVGPTLFTEEGKKKSIIAVWNEILMIRLHIILWFFYF